jgi:copper transport protein
VTRGLSARLGAAAALLGALLGACLVLAGPAAAHATIVTSNPADGSRLKSAPPIVTITFDEPVGLGNLYVVDQAGRRVETGTAFHPGNDGTKIAVNLKAGLGDGTYTESFRVISADSHPVAGVVRFLVGNGVLSTAISAGSTVNHLTSVAFDAARWTSYAGLALLGGVWLVLTVWPVGRDDRRARRILWTGWGAAVAGAVAELMLQGPYAAGLGVSGLTRWSLLDGTLHTDYGQYHCARLMLLGFTALLLGGVLDSVERRESRLVDALWPLAVAVVFTYSAVGHPDTTKPNWLSIPMDMLHLLAMSAWVGGLVLILGALLPRHEPDEQQTALPVFSRVAFAAVCVLAVTGTYAAWRGVGTVQALFTTTYGRLVLTKVVLFVGLLALGNLSRKALHGDRMEQMRRSVIVEIAVAVAVLAATAVLVAEPRGAEALAVSHRRPVSGTAALGGGRTALVTIDPGVHGDVTVSVALSPGPTASKVSATAELSAQQLGPIPIPLQPNGTDRYGASGVDLPAAGNWLITLVVSTSQFNAVTTDLTLHLY